MSCCLAGNGLRAQEALSKFNCGTNKESLSTIDSETDFFQVPLPYNRTNKVVVEGIVIIIEDESRMCKRNIPSSLQPKTPEAPDYVKEDQCNYSAERAQNDLRNLYTSKLRNFNLEGIGLPVSDVQGNLERFSKLGEFFGYLHQQNSLSKHPRIGDIFQSELPANTELESNYQFTGKESWNPFILPQSQGTFTIYIYIYIYL